MIGWQTRALSALMILVLAGSPALAAACDASCFGSVRAEARTVTSDGHEHDAAVVAGPGTPQSISAVGHEGHHTAAAAATTKRAPHDAVWLRSASGPQCCAAIGQPVTPLHVLRNGSGTIGSPHVEHERAVPVARPDRQAQRNSSLLPDIVSLTRAPLVLRV